MVWCRGEKDKEHELSRHFIRSLVNSAQYSLRDRALLSYIYLTGCRRVEASHATLSDFKFRYEDDCVIVRVYTAKKKTKQYRSIPIDLKIEKGIVEPLMDYVRMQTIQDRRFFPSPSRTSELIKAMTEHGVHCLRHTRATHLKTIYDFGDTQLMEFMGWTDPKMCRNYTHLTSVDLLDKMRRSYND